MTTTTHYTPPQTIAPLGLLFGVAAALAGALVLAPLYSIAIAYIPIIYLNALLTGGTAFGIGWGVVSGLRAGHFHNAALSYVIVLGTLVFAYWMHWIAWVAMMAFRADMSDFEAIYLLYPPALLDIIGTIYEEGTWSMRGSVVNGIPLGIAWLVEALIFFGVGIVAALGTVGTGTFCGRCKTWCKTIVERRLDYGDGGGIAEALNQRQDWSVLQRPEPPEGDPMWYSVRIEQCPTCRETSTLTLSSNHVTHDAKGNAETKSTLEVDRVYIPSADVARLSA